MCGIFGLVIPHKSDIPNGKIQQVCNRLFLLSESRGKEASGIALQYENAITVLKESVSSSKLIRSKKYKDLFGELNRRDTTEPVAIIGHSRLVTNGSEEDNFNNQPVIKDGIVGIHNGIVTNEDDLWKQYPSLSRDTNLDSEVLVSLYRQLINDGYSLLDAGQQLYRSIEGSASIALFFEDFDNLLLATNTGSLYFYNDPDQRYFIFCSEKFILQQLLQKEFHIVADFADIIHVAANSCVLLDISNGTFTNTTLKSKGDNSVRDQYQAPRTNVVPIVDISEYRPCIRDKDSTKHTISESNRKVMLQNWHSLYSGQIQLKRCSRCILTETVPYIQFDDEGVCNYCRNFEKRGNSLKGKEALEKIAEQYRSSDGSPDCIAGFSGGRDSGYGLDYVKNVLHLNPIAFTYDWAMVNDLARRNQARICGNLGVEQIVISADIKKKRSNIRKNLMAWLKRPELGMIPLLMAGDKEFYYHFHKVREQTGTKLFVFCGGQEEEEAPFKYGFSNVQHGVDNLMNCITQISAGNKLRLLLYYLKNYILNPRYINSSIFDTLFAYYSTYLLKDDYLYLFHYIEFDEETMVSHIRDKFNWEGAPDTIATWRIDDATAAFYNYVYLVMAGFTEFDSFRSIQIRQGKMSRDEAMAITIEENRPRIEAIEWYARAIDIDINYAIDVINSAPRQYPQPIEILKGVSDENPDNSRYRLDPT